MLGPDWFVITAKPRHEKILADGLSAHGFESFLPYYLARRQWSDRIKNVPVPLFPGYVFCRFDWNRRSDICLLPGYRSILSFGGEPTPVDPAELDGLRRIVQTDGLYEPHPFLRAGQRVRIVRGPLTGVEGILASATSSVQVVVSITILQRSVAVTLNPAALDPL